MSSEATLDRNEQVIRRGLPTEPPAQPQDDRTFDEMWNALSDRERQGIIGDFLLAWSEDCAFNAMGGDASKFDVRALEFRNKKLASM